MTQSILGMAELATPMAIRVAATLGLAEHGEATAAELASLTDASPSALTCLLDHLVTAGVFAFDAESGRYRPTELGAQLREDGVKLLLDIDAAGGRADLAFADLLGTITTGRPAYEQRYGRDFWTDLDAEPRLRRTFDAQMNWRFRVQAPQIAARFGWGRFARIVDVGGGDGVVLAEILRAHPSVRGSVLDLAPSAAAAARRFAADGLADRAEAVPGSFFDPLPPGADAYVLSDILHDWDDEHAAAILAGCRDAAGDDGTVVVIEPLRQAAGTAMDLFMLMCFGGRERTAAELTKLAEDCGLVLRATTKVSDGRTALEFRPATHARS
ncbi:MULTISPECIES: methyltransferase [unclassified Amycolatopsis]|uniref:methyltransferase n=1 Tax=unclassified Amycolatopsis TaxID=2618356 RepID=UPI002876CAB9|nr:MULTISPECIES: methyltransferase [unclassified Amycolatopsis]MDS0140409.1 methyltransferase [Amycolatopsis sp. 505]MDS0148986.1 methyltransferase [Amycolatopsis sp. CM201R]